MGRSEREKMLAGELYLASDPELVEARLRARRLCRQYDALGEDDAAGRRAVLSELFGAIGPGAVIEPPFRCDYGTFLHAGARLYLNFGCVFLDCAQITIGDDVLFGPGVHLYAATHPIDPAVRASGPELARPIRIGNRVWMGGGAIVCPGVTIGDEAVIGAGSVVSKSIPARVVAAGNPCRVIRPI
jgi:maltose O-acetyltransferase